MDNSFPNLPEPEDEPKPADQFEPQGEVEPSPEAEPASYVNERITHAYQRAKKGFTKVKDQYNQSPRAQKITYQGKFLPAFWTVACIFSLVVNIILIAALISFGRHFFALKALVSDGLVNGLSSNLALMDKAHIVTTIPVKTTVQLQDNLPVVFDLPLKQDTQVTLASDTDVSGTTLINLAPVPLDFTLPAGTPLKINLDMTIPVSQSIPVDITVPVSLLVPLDLAVGQTDLHQSIVGLESTLDPYKDVLSTSFNSPQDISFCNQWWSGWLCQIFFGK
ncbi:MAG TPA: hypothetical protein VF831_07775 [Anaerolineales bacterium]